MVNSVSTSSTNSTSNSSSAQSTNSPIMGKDDFMKMMIAQLQNQDPLNPMDGTQFSAQLAQFSTLEQMQNLNSTMTAAVNANAQLTQSVNNTLVATLIGKNVKLDGNSVVLNGQSNVNLGYNLPLEAQSVSVNIYNSSGALVKTITDCSTTKGDNKLSWDLTDNSGNKLADGNYTFEISAKSYDGSDMTTTSFKIGSVTGVKFTSNGTVILVDGADYNISDISEVLDPNNGGGN